MNKASLQDEMSYRFAKHLLKTMLQDALITESEFSEIVQVMLKEWDLPLAPLFGCTETIPSFSIAGPFPSPVDVRRDES